jgi:hypothetical protein
MLGNRREACIIFDNNVNSRYFKLGSGRPQGDNLSPYTFNFCEQMLIFKIELDRRISKIHREVRFNIVPNESYMQESNRETSNNESLADDNTIIFVLDRDSLLSIKDILIKFSDISGLECNYDKTALLPTHQLTDAERDLITESGFNVTDKIKLLGADITADPDQLCHNFHWVANKVLKQVQFWSRFKLSLPGRIIIAKTFMISLLNYLGCVFEPDEATTERIQELINTFVRKNLKISECILYLPPENGGAGFFNIHEFLAAQRCTWLLRAKKMCIDNWRHDLHALSPLHNPLLLRSSDINKNINPILHGIVKAYENFYFRFSEKGKNYYHSYIFENKLFLDPVSGNWIDTNFFGNAFYDLHKDKIRSLKYADCHTELGFKTFQDFRADGLPLTLALWMRLRGACMRARALAP